MEIVQGVRFVIQTEGTQKADKVIQQLDEMKAKSTAAGNAGAAGMKNLAAGVDQVNAAAGKQPGAKLATDLKKAEAAAGVLDSRLRGFLSVAVPVGVTATFALLTKAAINAADQIYNTSIKTGISAEQLSVWKFAADQADTSLEEITVGFRSMSRQVDEAIQGNQNALRSFQQLGITLHDLKTLNEQDLFLKIADGLAAIPDPAQRAARAQDVLGRSALQLLPLMKDLANGGFQKAADEAQSLGVVIGTDTAEAADHFNDNMSKLKAGLAGIFYAIANALLPALVSFTDFLLGTGSEGLMKYLHPVQLIAVAFKEIVTLAVQATGNIARMATMLGTLIEAAHLRKGDSLAAWKGVWDEAWSAGKAVDAQTQKRIASIWGNVAENPNADAATNRNPVVNLEAQAKAIKEVNDAKIRQLEIEKRIFDLTASSAAKAVNDEQVRHAEALLGFESAIAEAKAHNNAKAIDALKTLRQLEDQFHKKKMVDLDDELELQKHGILMPDMQMQIDALARFNEEIAKHNRETEEKRQQFIADGWMQTIKKSSEALFDSIQKSLVKVSVAYGDMIKGTTSVTADSVFQLWSDVLTGHKIKDAFASFAEGIAKVLAQRLSAATDAWLDRLQKAALGTPVKDSQGNIVGYTGGSRAAQLGLGAIQGAGVLYGLYQNGQNGASRGANALSGVVGGASVGATIGSAIPGVGTVVGAVVGGVIGGIAGWFTGGKSQQETKYTGYPGVYPNGEPFLFGMSNLNDAQQKDALQKIKKAYDDFWNGYVGILLKLPGSTLPKLGEIYGGFGQPNQGGISLGDWQQQLSDWIAHVLPEQMMPAFKEGLQRGFQRMGMDARQFNRFWDEASKLSQADQVKFWNDLIDGIAGFAEAQRRVNAVRSAPSLDQMQLDASGNQHRLGDTDFVSNLRTVTKNIFDQARAMVSLTGPDRIAAWKALGQSVEQVTQSFTDYINHLADVLRNMRDYFQNTIFEHDLAREKDPNAQAAMLKAQADRLLDMIRHAPELGLTADQVMALTQQAGGLLSRIYDLDPSEAANEWWHQQMATLNQASQDAIKALGEAAQAAMDKFLDELKPFQDYMLGLPVDLGAAFKLLEDDALPGFAEALDALATRLRNWDPNSGDNGANGRGPGRGRTQPAPTLPPSGPNDPNDPGNKKPTAVINVTVNGTVIGVDDLAGHIKESIKDVVRRGELEPSFSLHGD